VQRPNCDTDSQSNAQAMSAASQAAPFLRRYSQQLIDSSHGAPIVDVACGSGRNALFLAELGCDVFCLDRDLNQLGQILTSGTVRPAVAEKLRLCKLDLVNDPWPFEPQTVGGIINIHLTVAALFPCFGAALLPGGCLLVETVPAHGGNFLELPRARQLRSALEDAFDLEFYRERKAGPGNYDAVIVRLFAKRREA
jgi:SAM-dependent methyltransferase